ncbi:MAG: exodeoxyribonuclease VII large subunit [Acidobacteria bacterium]|nr:MAG: exodeoxyribonuclease VII large subunit [Acidobacteriota bacterium]
MKPPGGDRGLFDEGSSAPASPVLPAAAGRPGTRENPYSVSALNTHVRGMLEDRFACVWVVGETSNFSSRTSGHWYFTMKDSGGELLAVMFARENRSVKFDPRDGLEILARGRLTLYSPRGRYQLVVEEMVPRREGALQLALRQLEERLRAEGLFDPSRRRPIPLLPRRIGVVTSGDGAAFRDILRVLRDRFAAVTVVLRDTRVQGEGAAADIAAAIEEMNEYGRLDTLIVGRGGGSSEDLWAFNDERVVRAIASSRIPVISAVGHEVDITLSDLAADLRAATPSAAAEKVIASRAELTGRILRLKAALITRAKLLVEVRRRGAEVLARSRVLTATEIRVREQRQRLDELALRARQALRRRASRCEERLARLAARLAPRSLLRGVRSRSEGLASVRSLLLRAAEARLQESRSEFEQLAGLLHSLSPLAVLERGYAICFDSGGAHILRDASAVTPGDEVRVKLARGRLDCKVLAKVMEET